MYTYILRKTTELTINFDNWQVDFITSDIHHRGINVDQHSKPRNKRKYSILYLHLFCGFEC
jgi:hypothetical protein